jgi:hypothetical protein
LKLREYCAVYHEHPAVRQEDDRRRRHHGLITATEPRIWLWILQTTATMPPTQRSAEGRTPTAIRKDEAKNGEHHQKGSHPLTLLSGRESWSASDPDANSESTTVAHFAYN